MLRRIWFWGCLLAMGSMLVAGCGSLSSKTPPPQDSHSQSRKRDSDKQPSGEKLAEAHAHYAAGVVHEANQQPDAALREYYEAAIIDSGDEWLVKEVAGRFGEHKQPEKALEILTRAAERPNASGEIFTRLAVLCSHLGKMDQAAAASRVAIKKSPGSLAAYQTLFLNYLQKKQTQDAINLLDEAAKQPNPGFEFLVGLSELYAKLSLQAPAQKDSARTKALAVLGRAEKSATASPSMRLQLAEGFDALGDYTRAAELYLELLKKMPEVPLIREHVRSKLTDIYLRGENRKGAIEQLQAMVREDPTNPQPYYFLGRIAAEDKKLEEAIEYFSKTILLKKDFDQAYYELAIAQMSLNKTSDALATLQKARDRFSQNFLLEYLTALAFSHQKAYTEAIAHYTAAEVVAKVDAPKRLNEVFYFEVGAAYERKGDPEQAEKYFEKCLQLAPDFTEALNDLGYMWAERGVKLEKARELIEQALKTEPKNAAYLDSLGWVLFKLNQPKEALGHLLKAIELSKEPDATVFDHLGDVYAALKEPDKAREAWRKSLSLEASDQVKKKLEP
jgi:tetratricopeptide (TPR) repeat protein